MSATTNRETVLAYVQAMNEGDFTALRGLFSSTAMVQGVTGGGPVDAAMPVWKQLHESLHMELIVQSVVAEGDIVVVRYLERGRWTGPFMDFREPTGKSYELVAIEWFELKDGRIENRWGVRDGGSLARQVGFPQA